MPMLECDGVFTMPLIPEGWTATSNGSMYELLPPGGGAAVHISVCRREDGPVPRRPGEARTHLETFLQRATPDGEVQIIVVPETPDEQRVFARYVSRAEQGMMAWIAACIVWPHAMLLCTCNGTPGDGAVAEGERMLASIFAGTGDG